MSQELVTYQEKLGALSVQDVRGQVNLIQHIMSEVMKKDEHYGVIPGTGTKPTLLKAGAEKLCLTFRLDPQYEIEQKQEGVHLTIISKCTLWHIPSGQRFGSGMGSCSTKESKYAYRKASRKCPQCGSEAIIKGKEQYGGGWVCFKKKGGCGAKFDDGDTAIESQAEGRVPNEDIPDSYNTVLKMANKRSLVAAVLNATAASDIFTQDIEDMAPQTESAPAPSAGPLPSSPDDASAGNAGAHPIKSRTETLKELCKQVYGENWKLQETKILDVAKVSSAEEMSDADYTEACAMLNRNLAKRKAA